MKRIVKWIGGLGLVVGLASFAAAAKDTTMTGMISDSACGMSHAKMLAEHKDMKTDRDCTLACIKGGSKYVFVSAGKVYNISNQDLAGLNMYAGENAKVTADFSGDTIKVAKIAAAK